MLEGYTLRYLAAVAGGAPAEVAIERVPGVLRALVRAAARRHVIAAGFETEHAEDAAHVHRLAYLRAAGALVVSPNDVGATRHAFESGRRHAAEERAIVRLVAPVAGLLVLGAAAAGGWMLFGQRAPVTSPAASAPADAREAPPPEPAHPLTELFEETLPAYVVALDAASTGRERPPPHDVASERARVLDALEQRGPELVVPMTRLLDASEGYVAAAPEHDDARWLEELVRLHDALDEADVPFYVDAQLTRHGRTGRQRVLLSTYTVRAQRTFEAGGERVRCLYITRLDTLNIERSLLGFSIAEHEVQHRLDYEADRLVRVPDVLEQYTGETESEDRVNVLAERANAELSAYLAQIARRPSRARTSLVHVASFMMNRHAWGMPEAYAAVALFEAMASEAGISHEPLIARRSIVRAEAARIYGELRELEPSALSELAARTWTALYAAELVPLREASP